MKILVVDDEADVQPMFLQRFRKEIRNNELEFAFALSGFEALKYLQSTTWGRSLVISVNGEGKRVPAKDLLSQVSEKG
jgi:CheY-like chemotaxis protein